MASCDKKRKFSKMDAEVPQNINVSTFARYRVQEIEALSQYIEKTTSNKLLQQKLPTHMRRRATSHNIKRLPKRLQQIAKKEYENQKGKSLKRPSRKHRRRPRNLLAAYNRRKRDHVWLETHIWHAKRFMMVKKWGYHLACHPYDKGTRAAYRSTAHYCLMQDVSFLCCIEIIGTEEEMLRGFKHLTNTVAGPTLAAKTFLKGTREGSVVLYEYDKYPYSAIGPVTFIWGPHGQKGRGSAAMDRQLWLWCHPTIYTHTWREINKLFVDAKMPMEKGNVDSEEISPAASSVQVKSLKDRLLRFRLTGPLSQAVLFDVLKMPLVESSSSGLDAKDLKPFWWEKYFQSKANWREHLAKKEFWEKIKDVQTPAELPPHCVVGLTVGDPRMILPREKKTATRSTNARALTIAETTAEISTSALWSEDVRTEVKATKISEQEFNCLRSKCLIPGIPLTLGRQESRIPVLLIQRPGSQHGVKDRASPFVGFSSGWDVVLPAGWGMAFWIAFVYHGARVGGIREAKSTATEAGEMYFPNDFPDTRAAQAEMEAVKRELEAKHEKRPPAKRLNYAKLGIQCPFRYPWDVLVQEWIMVCGDGHFQEAPAAADKTAGFYVLRSKKELRVLSSLLQIQQAVRFRPPSILCDHRLALVSVAVKMRPRGIPKEFSVICIPESDDLQQIKELKEPKHKVPKKSAKSKKSLNAEGSTKDVQAVSVVSACSRKCIGFVTQGKFAFTKGQGSGLGFCSLVGLLQLLAVRHASSPCLVLVRSRWSQKYQLAQLSLA